jgi:hypothetical protein
MANRSIGSQTFIIRGGIPRSDALLTSAQAQTEETFGFKWKKRDTVFESDASLARMREMADRALWRRREGGLACRSRKPPAALIDAGCGAGMSALELFGAMLGRVPLSWALMFPRL